MLARPAALLAAILTIAGSAAPAAATDTVLVPTHAIWRYLDDGSNQGTAWRAPSFDDSSWEQGQAELGYGDGDEETTVLFGPSSSNKYTTTYFRRAFNATEIDTFTGATLRINRDDGAVVYLNGAEILRTNLPAGTINHTTLASNASPENAFVGTAIDPALLNEGTNVLAVEIHPTNVTSSDISFDLDLVATDEVEITRGPYLQLGTPSSIVVRWRTNIPTSTRVVYGTTLAALDQTVSNAALTTEHSSILSSLGADTRYYYAAGTTTELLAEGPRTSPSAPRP
jgi:hypothetical protein